MKKHVFLWALLAFAMVVSAAERPSAKMRQAALKTLNSVKAERVFTITWPVVSGATACQLEVTEIGTASGSPEEALQREFDFSGCISSTVGFTDISSSMANYGLAGWNGSKLYTTPNKLRIGTSTTTGRLSTPTWQMPESSDMTVAMGADVVKENTKVKGNMRIAYGNAGEQAAYEYFPFEISTNGRQIFHFSIRKDLFWIDIMPETQMYVNYLATYDGTWTEEQLGIEHPAKAPRYISEIKNYTTSSTSYTLTNLNRQNRYVFRVRSVGEENWYSQWSEEQIFVFLLAVAP